MVNNLVTILEFGINSYISTNPREEPIPISVKI
jgi:hypothetical protein